MNEQQFYRISEIAAMLHVSKRTVSSWIYSGRLVATNLNGDVVGSRKTWRITKEALDDFMAKK